MAQLRGDHFKPILEANLEITVKVIENMKKFYPEAGVSQLIEESLPQLCSRMFNLLDMVSTSSTISNSNILTVQGYSYCIKILTLLSHYSCQSCAELLELGIHRLISRLILL